MSYLVYKLIHLGGLMLVFLGLGAKALRKTGEGPPPSSSGALHGAGLLLMLLGGFGMLARLEIHWPWPGWVMGKVAIWVAIGALPLLVRRRALPLAWLVAVLLGVSGAYLALAKPF